jgi:transposase InsO family protein
MQLKALPGTFYRAGRLQLTELSPEARQRLRLLQAWEALHDKGLTSVECSRVLEVPRATIYRWRSRWRRAGPCGLEDGSRAPKRRRCPTWSPELVQAILELREQYGWGKDKLVILLHRTGRQVSTSRVGRILCYLKRRGLLIEPPRRTISARKRRPKRPYAIRKPKEYAVNAPGHLVQLDTLDLRPLPGLVLKQFTARDVISRWDVIEVYSVATARTASRFLDALKERSPFPIRAIQVDGGSEFMGEFETACQGSDLQLFVLPPRSPKLNGRVERAQRTHTEEFWERYDGDLDLPSLRPAVRAWERLYNTFRPHQALAQRTPAEYLTQCHPEMAPKDHSVSYVADEYSPLAAVRVNVILRLAMPNL